MNVTSSSYTSQVYASNKTTATKASSAYESVALSQPTDKMDEMKEKYKDVYTPIPETYSKADEELQAQKVYEAYPKYMTLTELLNKVDEFYNGEPLVLGQTKTQEQEEKQKIAHNKMNDWILGEYGSQEAFNEMIQGGQKVMNDYPVNTLVKENVPNAKELTRFRNAAIYEGLESGKTVQEAKNYAGSIIDSYMSIHGMPDTFFDTLVKAGRADPNATQPDTEAFKPNFSASNNTTWDLREYGIEDDWTKNNIYENDKAMISELEKKMGEFSFMLNNENLMKKANSKLDPSNQNLGQANHYKEYINNKYLPETNFALDIFKNYKIYDSVDVKA